jgi:hypothetical protein
MMLELICIAYKTKNTMHKISGWLQKSLPGKRPPDKRLPTKRPPDKRLPNKRPPDKRPPTKKPTIRKRLPSNFVQEPYRIFSCAMKLLNR